MSRFFGESLTIGKLLTENNELKRAIANLTHEDQIGYAKVLRQYEKDGKLFTELLFVETARDDKLRKVVEKVYNIEGNVAHFDALIVKFSNDAVMQGQEKALYLWRRVYGENTAPDAGFAIEEPGVEPVKYMDMLDRLDIKEREVFWNGIWELANDPEKLRDYGIVGIYGNVTYMQLRKGVICVFRITSSGQIYPDLIPDI